MSAASQLRVLITGANSGIGFELAKQLRGKGHDVLLACRDMQRGQAAAQQLAQALKDSQQPGVVHCDLADLSSVRKCAAEVQQRWPSLDVLVCNAAIVVPKPTTTVDGLDTMFQVNHAGEHADPVASIISECPPTSPAECRKLKLFVQPLTHVACICLLPAGHFLLTQLLQPQLEKSQQGRIVVVSSELYARVKAPWDKPDVLYPQPPQTYEGMTAYPYTKLLNIWFTRELAKKLPPHVTVNAVSPGFAPTTGLSRHITSLFGRFMMHYVLPWFPFTVTVAEGARRVGQLCLLPSQPHTTGQYFSKGGQVPFTPLGADDGKSAQLWQLTEQALAQAAAGGDKAAALGAAAGAPGNT
jgi:NAD(P)-dependent dehydrogenase (short-subunit alcohol dehydrogenase family)